MRAFFNDDAQRRATVVPHIKQFLEDDSAEIDALLTGDKALENARNIFAMIYFAYFLYSKEVFIKYFEEYPEKICSVLQLCINDEGYMQKPRYKEFLTAMLDMLQYYTKMKIGSLFEQNNVLSSIDSLILSIDLLISPVNLQSIHKSLADINNQLQNAEPNTLERMSFNQFHDFVVEYFDQDIQDQQKFAIITWLKHNVPTILQGAINEIPSGDFNDTDYIVQLFSAIYSAYLKSHPDELSDVIGEYFKNKKLIKNSAYRKMMETILIVMHEYVSGQLEYYPASKEDKPFDRKSLIKPIENVLAYVQNFAEIGSEYFKEFKKNVNSICSILDTTECVPKSVPVPAQVRILEDLPQFIEPAAQQTTSEQPTPSESAQQKTINAALMASAVARQQQKANAAVVAPMMNQEAQKKLKTQEQQATQEPKSEKTVWDYMWDGYEAISSFFRGAYEALFVRKG